MGEHKNGNIKILVILRVNRFVFFNPFLSPVRNDKLSCWNLNDLFAVTTEDALYLHAPFNNQSVAALSMVIDISVYCGLWRSVYCDVC